MFGKPCVDRWKNLEVLGFLSNCSHTQRQSKTPYVFSWFCFKKRLHQSIRKKSQDSEKREFAKSRSSNAYVLYIALPQTEGEKKGFHPISSHGMGEKNDPTNTTGSFPPAPAPTAWLVFRPHEMDDFGDFAMGAEGSWEGWAMKLLFFKSNPNSAHAGGMIF